MRPHNFPSYGTRRTIHLIVDNQIGFTTDSLLFRSSPYPPDIVDAPIFYPNGDNIVAFNLVCQPARRRPLRQVEEGYHSKFPIEGHWLRFFGQWS
ncbi:hypothetical protein DFP72DRAFT_834510 [Ephemerocybe angulata]|uniref:Uncharacterized protein n=1 Tax=Ephemerocybe angulata TaxID=980116 RepID=A0A8H6LU68_9AGAR|nr:hypothetical protein DFP72DRAFT_834510 [Tulosesus angulatus]